MLSVLLKQSSEEALRRLQTGKSAADVGKALEVPEGQLLYILYERDSTKDYRKFSIPKKSGGMRQIMAPGKSLNILQRKLFSILSPLYRPPPWVHGFVRGKGIVSNAKKHTGQRFVLNIDLENFYDHINFGRVRGVLQNPPFRFHVKVATVLAQALTHENKLPQGACTSPMIANLVAWPLDRKLVAFAKRHKLSYTRYADDITFSTTRKKLSIEWSPPRREHSPQSNR